MKLTFPEQFRIHSDFPPVGYDQWRSVVEEALRGAPFEKKLVTRTHEGIDIQPVYSRDSVGEFPDGSEPIGMPGLFPFVRGGQPLGAVATGWDLRPEHAHPDPKVANREILADLHGGATSIQLRLDGAARWGIDPDQPAAAELAGRHGVMVYGVDDLDVTLADVSLHEVCIALDAGAAVLPAAAALLALWQRRGVSVEAARGAFNADPLAGLACDGNLPVSPAAALDQLVELAKWTATNYPHVTAVGVDTSPYHDAGATAAQDLAFGIATAVQYLRAMTVADLNIDAAARQILFRIGLGTHHFMAIAKLRAARRLWSRVVQACGGSAPSGAMRIHARTSNRVLTERDPHVNLLRNAVAMFAAGMGGADCLTSVPFDSVTRLPDDFSRRIARNTVLILQDEAHLHRVVDPAGGSWFLDRITEQLAATAWGVFQEVEGQGGMLKALENGWVAKQVDAAHAARLKDIARRKAGITGVSEFPDIDEGRLVADRPDASALRAAASKRIVKTRPAVSGAEGPETSGIMARLAVAASQAATLGQMAQILGFNKESGRGIRPLELRRLAKPFEALRNASDEWLETHGQRPRVFLVNLGPLAHHIARATYSKNFFEAGGFEVIGNDGFPNRETAAAAFADSSATIAVICSSDKLYPELVPQIAPKLKAAGARSIVLAGNPGDQAGAWQAAGVDRFIFISCDVLQTLRDLLREEGVIESYEGQVK